MSISLEILMYFNAFQLSLLISVVPLGIFQCAEPKKYLLNVGRYMNGHESSLRIPRSIRFVIEKNQL